MRLSEKGLNIKKHNKNSDKSLTSRRTGESTETSPI